MANALDRAYSEKRSELEAYDIYVPIGERCIVWGDLVVNVPYGTPKTECRRKLNRMLKAAKSRRFKDTQTDIFAQPPKKARTKV